MIFTWDTAGCFIMCPIHWALAYIFVACWGFFVSWIGRLIPGIGTFSSSTAHVCALAKNTRYTGICCTCSCPIGGTSRRADVIFDFLTDFFGCSDALVGAICLACGCLTFLAIGWNFLPGLWFIEGFTLFLIYAVLILLFVAAVKASLRVKFIFNLS